MELRRVRYKEQRTDHTTNIAWHLPIFFASLVNVAAITKVVKEVTGKQNEKWSAQITTRTKSMYISYVLLRYRRHYPRPRGMMPAERYP
jgi:hypothetical protein